jgi:hypothetical protein
MSAHNNERNQYKETSGKEDIENIKRTFRRLKTHDPTKDAYPNMSGFSRDAMKLMAKLCLRYGIPSYGCYKTLNMALMQRRILVLQVPNSQMR